MSSGVSPARGFLLLLLLATCCRCLQATTTLNMAHMNDIHAHFEQVNVNKVRCHEGEALLGQCYGGMSRMYTKISELSQTEENFMFVNAGDYYSGTIWSDLYQFEAIVEFGNMLNYTAMSLGNHEFDDGMDLMVDFAADANYPILAANMLLTGTDDTAEWYSKSTVVEADDGTRVGLIGYVTQDTPVFATAGTFDDFEFVDEVGAVAAEAAKLKQEGVEILVAVGHSGYTIAQNIAREVADIDAVIGGHDHSIFLYTGDELPSNEQPNGDYPTLVTQESGKVVPVGMANCFTKYMGHMELRFDEQGELLTPVDGEGVSFSEMILLDNSIEQDPTVEEMLDVYRDEMTEYYEVLGSTTVLLDSGGNVESNLGNCITDAFADYWDDVEIAFQNDGGTRSSIYPGSITGEDIYYVLPFGNTIDRVTIRGEDLKFLLEYYVAEMCADASCGASNFLQFSRGARVVYDIREDNQFDRVSLLQRRCDDDPEQWCDLEMDKIHAIALPSYLADGGSRSTRQDDGGMDYNFSVFIIEQEKGPEGSEFDAMSAYVEANSPIDQGLEGRITVNYHEVDNGGGSDVGGGAGIALVSFETILASVLVTAMMANSSLLQ